MSDRPPSKPPRAKHTASSGQHPAVKAYRAKMESVDKGTTAATNRLDQMLQDFLSDLKTPVPPKLEASVKIR